MSLAIKYAMKKKMAHGGMMKAAMPCAAHGMDVCHMCHGGQMMAKGGEIREEKASGYQPMPIEHEEHHDEHAVENQEFPMEEEDMISRIMKQRERHYSEGGRVANNDEMKADFEPNQFDDMVKDDHLNEHYTGENSGDEIGDEQEDEDRNDMVSRIMTSRRKKDRLPHPM